MNLGPRAEKKEEAERDVEQLLRMGDMFCWRAYVHLASWQSSTNIINGYILSGVHINPFTLLLV